MILLFGKIVHPPCTHTSHMYCNIRLNEHFRVSDSSKKIASRYVIIAYHWLIFSELMTHIFLHLQQQFDYSDICMRALRWPID